MIRCDEIFNLIANLNSEKEYKNKYEEIIKLYPDCVDKINLVFYDMYNYEPSKTNPEEIREKRQDDEYREAIRKKYNYRCSVTNQQLSVCQVAHIYPHKLCNPEEKYDISNGILLSANLHLLFDSFQFKINPDSQIMTFSQNILNDSFMDCYKQYHNKIFPHKLSQYNINYLIKKYKN